MTLGDALTVYPFDNAVAVSSITGANLWKAPENDVSDHPAGRFPQISGFRFAFDTSKADAAAGKVTQVPALEGRIQKIG